MANIEKITSQLKKFTKGARTDSRKSPTFALHNLPTDQEMKEFKEAVRDLVRVYGQILQEAGSYKRQREVKKIKKQENYTGQQ